MKAVVEVPRVPLPAGFADRLKQLQRELLRDLQTEETWKKRFQEYYNEELVSDHPNLSDRRLRKNAG